MAALTLEAWRDRTLEQVHFAAKAALNAVVVQGNSSIRQCVAATATGDLNQCLTQGPNIDSVCRMAQGMAVRCTAAPGCATTLDPKGVLSLNNLAEAMQRLGVENALCHMLQPHHVLQPGLLQSQLGQQSMCDRASPILAAKKRRASAALCHPK